MDHINDILSSDLLKRYVLREVTAEEVLKVDLLKVDHSVIRQELRKLEKDLKHNYNSKEINRHKECIIKNISGKEQSHYTTDNPSKTASNFSSWLKVLLGLTLGILGTWLVMDSQLTTKNKAIVEVETDMANLEKDYEELNQQYVFINHAGTTPYLLDGKALNKKSQVIIYWNNILQRSQLRVIELPAISKDQTYQLWADVDGEMRSLGVFDPTTAIVDAIDMKYIERASSLNITVEVKGGSDHPTIKTLTASTSI